MDCRLRVLFPGAICRVMNRGDCRQPIFPDDPDLQPFLQTLAEACAKTDWQLHAWCLMGNHFHGWKSGAHRRRARIGRASGEVGVWEGEFP